MIKVPCSGSSSDVHKKTTTKTAIFKSTQPSLGIGSRPVNHVSLQTQSFHR